MDCKECHERFRADKLIEDFAKEHGVELTESVDGWSKEKMADFVRENEICNVFVSASPEARIERLMRLHHITAEKAEELMEKADKKRSTYYNYYSYKTWGAAATYHLCIDSSVLGIEGTIDFIKQFVKLKLQLP